MMQFNIISTWKNLALDVPEAKAQNGQRVHAWALHGNKNQAWIFKDGFILSAINPEFCLDIAGGRYENGNQVLLWKKHGGLNQKWIFEDGYLLCEGNRNFCLDIDSANGKNGSKIQIWKVVDFPNQRWRMVTKTQLEEEQKQKKVFLLSKWKNFAVDVPQSKTQNGEKVHAWAFHGEKNQSWIYKNGFIYSALNPDYCLDVYGPIYKNGSQVHLWSKHGGSSQRWVFEDGYLLNEGNKSFCLDIDNSTGKNGSKIQIYKILNNVNQQWQLLTKEQIQNENEKETKHLAAEQAKVQKEEAQQNKLKEHKFKTSKGETFCVYCGEQSHYTTEECPFADVNHNFVVLKEDNELVKFCNNCAGRFGHDDFSVCVPKEKSHKFKSSNGQVFCQFCGEERGYAKKECEYRNAGHQIILTNAASNDKTCNKCGKNWGYDDLTTCN